MYLPDTQEIEALHRKYAPTNTILDLVFTHCQVVWDVADQLIARGGIAVDIEVVQVGCLLHDIGMYPLFDENGNKRENFHYVTHGIHGESILKEEGLPEAIWRFAAHHTGVGLSQLDIVSQNLPLPMKDYEAETQEERLVMYADKFHSKTNPPCLTSFDWYKHYVAQFGQDKVERFERLAQEFGIPDLTPLVEKYGHKIRN